MCIRDRLSYFCQTELDGKPNLAKVTELINGVKEQFSSVGLRNYVLGTGTPKTAGNTEKIYTFSKDSFSWTPETKLRLSFDYTADAVSYTHLPARQVLILGMMKL